MKYFIATLSIAFAIFGLAQTALSSKTTDSDVNYLGSINLQQITVVKNGVRKTYEVDPSAAADFSLGPVGTTLSLGRLTPCSPYIGDLETELRLRADVKIRYRDAGGNWTFRVIKKPAGAPGAGTIIVPAGTRAYGNCGGSEDSLIELTLQTEKQNPVVVQMDLG